jgi:hypothetical protein
VLPRFGAAGVGIRVLDAREATPAIALHAQYRVHHQLNGESALVQHHRKRIDQERHVLDDEFDPGVRRLPAMDFDCRVEYAHQRLARTAGYAEAQMPGCGRCERGCVGRAQILFIHATVVRLHEVGEGHRQPGPAQRARTPGDIVDEVLPGSRNRSWHGCRPVAGP